ncbi:hypothetical protein F5882DRAFT_403151 [Hyaloscypha sp. PMI_1271]|nr:hypothetical protein F5882DRAFT_403151 [Hyaloscypha sp. PMI_1271]
MLLILLVASSSQSAIAEFICLKGNAVLVAPEEGPSSCSLQLREWTPSQTSRSTRIWFTIAFAPGAVSDASSTACTKSKDRKSTTRESAFRCLMRGKMVSHCQISKTSRWSISHLATAIKGEG